ncbi:MAG: anti-phage dCTP deaminase [Candidatus Paceibacteria bacterium]
MNLKLRLGDHELSKQLKDAELIIGLVGRMGVDTKEVVNFTTECLNSLNYKVIHIKITDFLKEPQFNFDLRESPIEERYDDYIKACNKIREVSANDSIFAAYAISRIMDERALLTGNHSEPAQRQAYIIDQLKRKEEAEELLAVYGQQFILISCHMPSDKRIALLSRKIADGHAEKPKQSSWQNAAQMLAERDDDELNVKHGQRVSKVFPLADVIIDPSQIKAAKETLQRFFFALFGNFKISPTRDEFFQNIAYQTSLASIDTARQVGASIAVNGTLVVTGYNEAPKAFGGTYWPEDGFDARDVALGKDINTVRKRQMVLELVSMLKPYMSDEFKNDPALDAKLLDDKDAPLKNSQIMDSLEFGRAVHAEMSAITTAARTGMSIQDGDLYCTTFPCHNCSKHIVAAGIKTVSYLEPYAKSFTSDLYPDSIEVDMAEPPINKVLFKQFLGITPLRFSRLFSKSRMKDDRGNILLWKAREASPNFGKVDQDHPDRESIFSRLVFDGLSPDAKQFFGIEPAEGDGSK